MDSIDEEEDDDEENVYTSTEIDTDNYFDDESCDEERLNMKNLNPIKNQNTNI